MHRLAAAALVLVAVAGCLYQPDTSTPSHTVVPVTRAPDASPAPPNATARPSWSPPSSAPPPDYHPPRGEISAAAVRGSIPFNVTFTLSGSDADGREFWWTFDADGDGHPDATGDSLHMPTKFSFTYLYMGHYTARLSLYDRMTTTVTSLQVIADPDVQPPIQQVSGSYDAGLPDSCTGNSEVPAGYGSLLVDPRTVNDTFHVRYQMSAEGTGLRVTFYDLGHNSLGPGGEVPNFGPAATTFDGYVPENASEAVITSCGGALVNFEYESPGNVSLQHVDGSYDGRTTQDCTPSAAAPDSLFGFYVAQTSVYAPFHLVVQTNAPANQLWIAFFDANGALLQQTNTTAAASGNTVIDGAVPGTAFSGQVSSCGGGVSFVDYVAGPR
ncbi:MAG: hypothetical protein ACYDBQ_04715 [Thermoplasmatota archaeon]